VEKDAMNYPSNVTAGISGVLPPNQAAHLIYSKGIPMLQHFSRITAVILLLRATHPLLFIRRLPPLREEGNAEGSALGAVVGSEDEIQEHCDLVRVGEHLQSLGAVIAYYGWEQVMRCRVKCALLSVVADLCEALPASHQRGLVPTQIVQLMLQIVTDPYLDVVHVHLRTRFARLLRHLDAAAYSIYEDMLAAWQSIVAARSAFASDAAALSVHQRVDGLQRAMAGLLYDASQADTFVVALGDCILSLGDAHVPAAGSAPPSADSLAELSGLEQQVRTMLLETLAWSPNSQQSSVLSLCI